MSTKTEAEAMTAMCFLTFAGDRGAGQCIGSKCMAWRDEFDHQGKHVGGFCGLAGPDRPPPPRRAKVVVPLREGPLKTDQVVALPSTDDH